MARPEDRIISKILVRLRALDRATARKVHGGPYSGAIGEPDIDAVINGAAWKLEVKTPGSEHSITTRTTTAQRHRLQAYRAAGAIAEVVVSVEEVEILLDHYRPDPPRPVSPMLDFHTERIRARSA